MKKLLVLALVLSVVGIANAGLAIVEPVAGIGQVQIVEDMQGDQYMAIVSNIALSNFKTVAGGTASGEFFKASDLGFAPAGMDGYIWNIATFPGESYPRNGVQLQADWNLADALVGQAIRIEGDYKNTYNVYSASFQMFFCSEEEVTGNIQNAVYDKEVLVDSVLIPEPMTMILLGLGGLFLRRK